MKNKITLSTLTLLLIFSISCSTESNTELEAVAEIKTDDKSITRRPGDGSYDVLGAGYDVTKEFANANSAGFQVIDIEKYRTEQGSRLIEELAFSSKYSEVYGENAYSYTKSLSKKIESTSTNVVYGETISSAFTQNTISTNKFEGKYIYGSYTLEIKNKRLRFNSTLDLLKNYLTPEFLADLNSKTPQQIVQDYGTHILLDIYTGAKLDVLYQSETRNTDRALAARAGVKSVMETVFETNVSNEISTTNATQNYNRKVYYNTRGGDPSKSLIGTIDLEKGTVQNLNTSNWQSSSNYSNSVLIDIAPNGLVYIYDLISDATKKAQIKQYVNQYIINRSVTIQDIPVNIYGFYSRKDRDHYYSKANQIPNNYDPEGIPFKAFSYPALNTVPIYMYYSEKDKDHYYSQSNQIPKNYKAEGIEFYAYPNQQLSLNGAVSVYMFYSKGDKDHYYSQSSETPRNFAFEKIEFYAIP